MKESVLSEENEVEIGTRRVATIVESGFVYMSHLVCGRRGIH